MKYLLLLPIILFACATPTFKDNPLRSPAGLSGQSCQGIMEDLIDGDYDDESFFYSHYFNVDENFTKTPENERILKFIKFSTNRYSESKDVERIAEKLYDLKEIKEYTENADFINASLDLQGPTLVTTIPYLQLRDTVLTSSTAGSIRLAKVLSPVFYATMASIGNPAIKEVRFVMKDVVNPDLAKMLSDLGFKSTHFKKVLDANEVESILGKNRVTLPKKVDEPNRSDFATEEAYEEAIEKWEDYEMEIHNINKRVMETQVINEGNDSLTFEFTLGTGF